jgi:integrase
VPIYKRCGCEPWSQCPHPYHFRVNYRGKTYRGTTKKRTKQDAERIESQKLAALSRGETTGRKVPKLATYLPDFETWITNHQTLRPESKTFYKRGIKLLAASKLAEMHLDEITDSVCVGIRFSKAGPASENQALRTLRRVLAEAARNGWLPRPPRLSLRPEEGRKLILDDGYEAALAPHLGQDSRDVICLMRQTGCRPSEVLAMNWMHVDWENWCYRVPRGKTKKSERTVLLASAGLEVLHRRHVLQNCPRAGWVFPCARAATGHRTSIEAEFRTARKKAGLPQQLVLYCARHDAGTNFMRLTGNPKLVQDLLGHSDISTTGRYVHPQASEVQKIRDAFDLRRGEQKANDSTSPAHSQNALPNLQNLKVVSNRPQ